MKGTWLPYRTQNTGPELAPVLVAIGTSPSASRTPPNASPFRSRGIVGDVDGPRRFDQRRGRRLPAARDPVDEVLVAGVQDVLIVDVIEGWLVAREHEGGQSVTRDKALAEHLRPIVHVA